MQVHVAFKPTPLGIIEKTTESVEEQKESVTERGTTRSRRDTTPSNHFDGHVGLFEKYS